jgi:GT2 family glycosyltransferase
MKTTLTSCTKVLWERWHDTELGSSITCQAKIANKINQEIYFENTKGLSECYNEVIEAVDDDECVIFCHDDVKLLDTQILEKLEEGFKTYDIIGVAGTSKYTLNSPCLWHRSEKTAQSGKVKHSKDGNEWMVEFGPHRPCVIVDGLFIAVKNRDALRGTRFDPQFTFHHYDMDFCLSAKRAGVNIGTIYIDLIHYSVGEWRNDEVWFQSNENFINKWKSS